MKKTLQQQHADFLISKGYQEVQNPKTKKYRVFTHQRRPNEFYFLGKAGAVRRGPKATLSVPVRLKLAVDVGSPNGKADEVPTLEQLKRLP